ncbi:MAG TPA: hypothetical protein VEK80_02525 [Kribbellaceae bacterium]|nr:hypothetical protein [Kribbellaceae bacterium]
MFRLIGRTGTVLALGVASALTLAGTASADPLGSPRSFQIELVCDNGQTYQIVLNGNGEFAVGHDLASNSIVIPTAFGPFHGVLTDDEGNVVDEFTDPAVAKGSSTKQRATSTSCTFEVDDTFEIPGIGVVHFHGEGSAVGFVTPVH